MTDELLKCKVPKCLKLRKSHCAYCSMHQARLDRTGRLSLKSHKEKLLENIKINKNNCWEWQKYKNELGYGRLRYRNKKMLAHRLSYLLFKGKIPKNILVCHSCDNPSCINPEHLFLGNQKDNAQDAAKKGHYGYWLIGKFGKLHPAHKNYRINSNE